MYMTQEKLAEYRRAQRARAKCIALYLRHRKKFREQRRAINRAIRGWSMTNVLYLDALKPFDALPSGPCESCHRQTLCMVFQIPCEGGRHERHNIRFCVECLIEYAQRLSTIARGNSSIADLIDAPLDRRATRLIRKPTAEDF